MIFSRVHYNQIGQYYEFIKSNSLPLEVFVSSKVFDTVSMQEITEQVLQLKDLTGGKITIHGPFSDLSPGAMDEKIRQVTHLRFLQVMDLADAIKPESLVLHSGYEKWRFDHTPARWVKGSLPLWREVAERAERSGCSVAIENIFEDEPTSLAGLIEKIGSPRVGVCFDTGHFNLFSRHPLSYWMEVLGPMIKELHLHDNRGDRDTHGPLGSGTFAFSALFDYIKGRKDIVMTVEANKPEDALSSINSIKAYLAGSS